MEKHEMRDWAALPRDILLEIFGRLKHADILRGAGFACAPWWRAAAEEPTLWRTIDVSLDRDDHRVVHGQFPEAWLAMGRAAVDRSAGRCESFTGIVDCDFLAYLAAGAPSLRSLELTRSVWFLPDGYFDRVVTKLPMLERLVLTCGELLKSELLGLFEHCPRLQVLDAGECFTDEPIEVGMLRLPKKMKALSLPKFCCGWCSSEWRMIRRVFESHRRIKA